MSNGLTYRIDPGAKAQASAFEDGFRNADIVLSEAQLLENIQKVQRRQNLPVAQSLTDFSTSNAQGERVAVQSDEKGEYARVFEEEYQLLKNEYLSELAIDNPAYRNYLEGIDPGTAHSGYFSIDKKTNRLKDPAVGARSVDSDDVDAYDLILKDKENLLTIHGPNDDGETRAKRMVRFIFSHSALREGWDNPNVLTDEQLRSGDGFKTEKTTTEYGDSIHSLVRYDLLGKVAENTQLTRQTTANILHGIEAAVFKQFQQNPEHFIAESSRLITEQKAAMVIERLAYDEVDERYDVDIFTANQAGQDFSRATEKLSKHVYDYAITDSDVERRFVKELDTSSEVVVYAKLPRGFLIPTPVGDYNPDWAISFQAGSVRHIYFVAETKGSMSSMKLREIEKTKIECARKFFDEISQRINPDKVKYDVVTDYTKLMDVVGRDAKV